MKKFRSAFIAAAALSGWPASAEPPSPPPPDTVSGDNAGNAILYFGNAGECQRYHRYYEGLIETAEEQGTPWYWSASDRCTRNENGEWSFETLYHDWP